MDVARFVGEYDDVAGVLGQSAERLKQRDATASSSVMRWVAREEGRVVGAATLVGRPDGRQFLSFGESSAESLTAIVYVAAGELPSTALYVRLAESDGARIAALVEVGFAIDLTLEEFRVDFAHALVRLRKARVPGRYRLAPPDALDPERCLALDNELRHDVPGIDGWRGDLAAWNDELRDSPPYDRSGYFVAVDQSAGDYAGLIRFWRNDDGPRLGLLGVTRPHRGTLLAAGLLKAGLSGASEWGHKSFLTDSSTTNQVTYRALTRLGAASTGRAVRLRLVECA